MVGTDISLARSHISTTAQAIAGKPACFGSGTKAVQRQCGENAYVREATTNMACIELHYCVTTLLI